MTDSAVSIVADTLRTHNPEWHLNGKAPGMGWWSCSCLEVCNSPIEDVIQHQAEAVVDALGGLTRAWAAALPDDSFFGPYHESHEFHPGEARRQAVADVAEYEDSQLSSRWVSGWVREPAEEERDGA